MAKALFGDGYVEVVCETWEELERVTMVLALCVKLGVLPESFAPVPSRSEPGRLFVGKRKAIDLVMGKLYKEHKAQLRDVCPCGHPRSAHTPRAFARKCAYVTAECGECECTAFDEKHRTARAAS